MNSASAIHFRFVEGRHQVGRIIRDSIQRKVTLRSVVRDEEGAEWSVSGLGWEGLHAYVVHLWAPSKTPVRGTTPTMSYLDARVNYVHKRIDKLETELREVWSVLKMAMDVVETKATGEWVAASLDRLRSELKRSCFKRQR